MELGFAFFFNSLMLGIGLSMDAFSVSLANGLNEPCMKRHRMCFIAGVFAFFQAMMPIIGWACVRTVAEHFAFFQLAIPWIALGLLGVIGGKMIYDGIKNKEETACGSLGISALLLQGVATSIDALSVGFTISEYNFISALLAAVIIAVVTFIICFIGVLLGQKAGTALSGKAGILGGAILIFIGLEIFITGIL